MSTDRSDDRVKVAYVMGAGHSGSTILGVTLGNCKEFFYAGELEEWLMTPERPRWGGSERQRFWGAVRERVAGAERLRGAAANRCIERSSAILRADRWLRRRKLLGEYRLVAERLLRAVAEVSGARYVVDTSHFPLRARELRRLSGVELYLIFLVRDPQDVVASNTRELSPHEVAERRWRRVTMNANLWLTQLLAVIVFLSHPARRRVLVRHEDFLANPREVTRRMLDALGSAAEVPDLGSLQVGAPLQGNQLIRTETVAVRSPSSGGAPRGRRDTLTWLLQLPWEPVLRALRPVASPCR